MSNLVNEKAKIFREIIFSKNSPFDKSVIEIIHQVYTADFQSAWTIKNSQNGFIYLQKTINNKYSSDFEDEEIDSFIFETLL